MKKSATTKGESPSRLIDARIKELDDWRGKTLSHVRTLIKQTDPEVVEEWKWRGVPVLSHDGIICTGETYKSVVKLTFAKGASLKDPSGLFNSSLEGNTRRAIDLHQGDELDEDAFKALIRAAAALNRSPARQLNPAPHAASLQDCDGCGLSPAGFASTLPTNFLCEGIAQADGAAEHRAVRRRILVADEITLALELHDLAGMDLCDRGLDARILQNFQRLRIEVGGEIGGVRIGFCEQLVVDANFGSNRLR